MGTNERRGGGAGGEQNIRTAGVKHGGPEPCVDAQVGPGEIEGPHWVRGVHAAAQPVQTKDVHEQVRDGERDGRGLLHARPAPERPLAVELLHAHAALQRQVRHRVHAAVLAVVRARPARQPQREGQRASGVRGVAVAAAGVAAAAPAAVVVGGGAGLPCAYVEASLEHVRAIAARSVRGRTGCRDHDKPEREKVQAHDTVACFALLCFGVDSEFVFD